MNQATGEMSLLEHLEELRWRLIKSIVAVVVFAVPCGVFWERIFDIVMVYPLRFADPKPRLIVTSPVEAILLSIKIAVAGGVIFAAPVIFYQFWRFVSPGLYKKEKLMILPTVAASTLAFLLGIGFCYLMIPYVIRFLAEFAQGRMEAMFKTDEYLSFLIKLSLAFGVVFELPVASFALTRMGVLTPGMLIKGFRYAIVAIFILAAALTPPDVLSQLLLAAPLLALYGLSILVSFVVLRRKS